jgi:cytochrome b subunit of formate dehydrogenase
MKKNVGKMDRIVRFAIAITLIILAYAGIIPSFLSLATYVVAILIAFTGVIRICLLYKPFGISTCREKSPF